MNVAAATKQPAPGETVRAPRVGEDVYFYDTERPPNEFGGIGRGPFTARVLQVIENDGKPTLLCFLKVMTPGGDLPLNKIGHKSTIAETRAHRYWEWPPPRN